jgi:hypothetical protein
MGRYQATQDAIFSVFGSASWIAEGVKTFPWDVIALDPGPEYIRLTIIPSSQGINIVSISGVCIIDIFTVYGNGPEGLTVIADKLDKHLGNKTVFLSPTMNVQFGSSTLSPRGQDQANSTLNRSSYTIPFNLFGVPF